MKRTCYIGIFALIGTGVFGQNGMETAGAINSRFSRLKTPTVGPNPNPPAYERAIGVYQANILPQSFLEVNSTPAYMPFLLPGLTTFNSGEMFRTSSDVNSHWRMFVTNPSQANLKNMVGHIFSSNWTAPAVTGADLNIENQFQMQIGPLAKGGDIIFNTTGPQNFVGNNPLTAMTEKVRILGNRTLGAAVSPGGPHNRSGFVGFNNSDPLFHLDITSPAFTTGGGGELYIRATTTEKTNTDIGFCNAAGGVGDVLPTIFGKTGVDPSGRSQVGPALMVLGNIDNTQDISGMNASAWAATRFMSSRNWQYNNFAFTPQPIANVNLFSWSNQSLIDMIMNANGRLLIRNSLNAGTAIPGNRVEITASNAGGPGVGPADPYMPLTANGASGLRFTMMTSTCTPMANPGAGVLSVDKNGDVIYVPGGGAANSIPAVSCTATPSQIASSVFTTTLQVPMGIQNIMFNETSTGGPSQFGIGHINNTCNNTFGKLEVLNQTNIPANTQYRFAGVFINTANIPGANTIGAGGQATSTVDDAKGVVGTCLGAGVNGYHAIGVDGISVQTSGAPFNYGVAGEASNGVVESVGGIFDVSNSNSPSNFGIRALAFSGNPASVRDVGGIVAAHIGAQKCVGMAGGINYNNTFNVSAGILALPANISVGVYGYNPTTSPATAGPKWAGWFDGNVMVAGSGTINVMWVPSDMNLKKNITPLKDVASKISALNGYTYQFRADEFPERNFDSKTHIGFIAQELKKVFPELINEDEKGNLTVDYMGMLPILLEAIKDQSKQIKESSDSNIALQQQLTDLKNQNQTLQARMDKLEDLINSCCSVGAKVGTTQNVDLSDKNVIVLNQNVPNPFAESTIITYNIPSDFIKAQIIFSTTEGKIIKAIDIKEKGNSRLNVYANDLSSGMYSYSLVIDGKVVDTKKMVKQD